MISIDRNFYPGWVRKAITFSIDDGYIPTDTKLLAYVKPAGIRGTFNLSPPLKAMSPAEYVEFYRGFEIANHCKFHLFPPHEGYHRSLLDEAFGSKAADTEYTYPTEHPSIRFVYLPNSWKRIPLTEQVYMECVEQGQMELEDIFGKGSVRDFVWPFGRQPNEVIFEGLKQYGFRSIRDAYSVKDTTGFALPADRTSWSHNADHRNLCELAEMYESYPDDGELKLFVFGIHSVDFENDNKWNDLEQFCKRYGNRPNDFWYATVGEIFDYEDAVRALVVTEEKVINPSPLQIFLKIDGKPVTLPPMGELTF